MASNDTATRRSLGALSSPATGEGGAGGFSSAKLDAEKERIERISGTTGSKERVGFMSRDYSNPCAIGSFARIS